MPFGTALRPALAGVTALTLFSVAYAASAQANLDFDRQLARQYAAPLPAEIAASPDDISVVDDAAPAAGFDEAAAARLEQQIDEALAKAEAEERAKAAVPPTPLATAALVSSVMFLFAFAGVMLTLIMRKLRKDQKQRLKVYRRRMRRRGQVGTQTGDDGAFANV